MSRLWLVMWVVASITMLILASFVVVWYIRGGHLYTVQTGSMQPSLLPGDAVIIKPVGFTELRPGQIVSFRDRQQPGLIITHRVTSINSQYKTVTTKGDHNAQADLPISGHQIIGQATLVAPHLGKVIGWLRQPLGLVLAVYIPAMLIIGHELLRWRRRTVTVHYQLRPR